MDYENRPSHLRVLFNCKHPAWIFMLFIFLMSFVFQGCVIHRGHSRHSGSVTAPAPITFTFTDHHRHVAHNYYHKHPHGKKHRWKKKWRHKKKSHLHRDIQMQAVPYDLARQLPHPPRGTRYIYDAHQVLLVNVNTRVVLDFINISVSTSTPRTVDRIPSYEEQHPSNTHQPPSHARSYEVAQGKPFSDEDHPSSHGQGHNKNKVKPDMDEDHPSSMAQENRKGKGKTDRVDNHPSPKGKDKQGKQKGGPHGDKGRPTDHAKIDKGHQGGQKGGHQKNDGRPSKIQGKPLLDSDNTESHQMASKGKSDRGKPKGKGKQKDTLTDSSQQENSSMQSSSPSKNKRKPSKQNRNSGRGRSGQQEEAEQVQPNSTHDENIQVAKVERSRGKDKSKGPGKGNKKNRGKRDQQADIKAALTQQEPAPTVTSPEPATTASFVPMQFDNNQRSIIQSYYQKSGSKRSGKGKKSKRNKTSSVAKNDILTQPTEPLPRNLESQLPPSPHNTRRILYNQQVVLIEQGTNKVLDVININN
jgi:Ni/Co efflux regulator RcnB